MRLSQPIQLELELLNGFTGSTYEKDFDINIIDDESDNCNPNLSYSGDINSFGSLRVNQTDSLNPSETDYKIIALPFDGYSLSNLDL